MCKACSDDMQELILGKKSYVETCGMPWVDIQDEISIFETYHMVIRAEELEGMSYITKVNTIYQHGIDAIDRMVDPSSDLLYKRSEWDHSIRRFYGDLLEIVSPDQFNFWDEFRDTCPNLVLPVAINNTESLPERRNRQCTTDKCVHSHLIAKCEHDYDGSPLKNPKFGPKYFGRGSSNDMNWSCWHIFNSAVLGWKSQLKADHEGQVKGTAAQCENFSRSSNGLWPRDCCDEMMYKDNYYPRCSDKKVLLTAPNMCVSSDCYEKWNELKISSEDN